MQPLEDNDSRTAALRPEPVPVAGRPDEDSARVDREGDFESSGNQFDQSGEEELEGNPSNRIAVPLN